MPYTKGCGEVQGLGLRVQEGGAGRQDLHMVFTPLFSRSHARTHARMHALTYSLTHTDTHNGGVDSLWLFASGPYDNPTDKVADDDSTRGLKRMTQGGGGGGLGGERNGGGEREEVYASMGSKHKCHNPRNLQRVRWLVVQTQAISFEPSTHKHLTSSKWSESCRG